MRSNNKHTAEELKAYIHKYVNDGVSITKLRGEYGLLLSAATFRDKVHRYLKDGLMGIQSKRINNHYSQEFKHLVVREHLEEGASIIGLARKYNIPAKSTVSDWITKYTKGKGLKSYSPKPEVYTMKGRKTTYEEKIEIVKDCLANGLSYKETAEKYNVSYNNIYSWIQKYKEYDPDGLIDGRGKRKPDSIQTDEEKLKTEIAALKARNEYLETENAALKKLKEMERELRLRKQDMRQNTKRLQNLKNRDLK